MKPDQADMIEKEAVNWRRKNWGNKSPKTRNAETAYIAGRSKGIERETELEYILKLYFDLMKKAETEQHFDHLLQEHNWDNKAKQLLIN